MPHDEKLFCAPAMAKSALRQSDTTNPRRRLLDRPLARAFGHFAGLRGTMLYDGLRSGAVVYRMVSFRNGAVA